MKKRSQCGIGVVSSVFHLANGVWTAGITWGLWITPAAQKRADYIALGLGVAMAIFGTLSLWGLSDPKLVEAGLKLDPAGHATPAAEPATDHAPPAADHAAPEPAAE